MTGTLAFTVAAFAFIVIILLSMKETPMSDGAENAWEATVKSTTPALGGSARSGSALGQAIGAANFWSRRAQDAERKLARSRARVAAAIVFAFTVGSGLGLMCGLKAHTTYPTGKNDSSR